MAASEPTNTKTVRNKYGAKLRGRFADIGTAIRGGVRDRDVFGLTGDALAHGPIRDVPDFPFDSDSRKHGAFMSWLRQQIERGVLSVISRNENTYIRSAYQAGIQHADAKLYEEGIAVSDEDLQAVFNRPIHQNTVELLYTRNFEALQGITNELSKQIGRELSNGLTQGWGADKMARALTDRVDSIGKTRATTLARTETLHSHNQASLRRYEGYDVEKVDILGHNPCDICEPIVAGGPYPIDNIPRGGPPFHPNCKGSVAPRIE